MGEVFMATVDPLSDFQSHNLTWSKDVPANQSVFLDAWTHAIKAIVTGEAVPEGHWLALDMLTTLANESQDLVLRQMSYEAQKRTPSLMKKYADFVARLEQYRQIRTRYNYEKDLVRRSFPSWEWVNWKWSKEALVNNSTELLEHAVWTVENKETYVKPSLDMEDSHTFFWKASKWRNVTVSRLLDHQVIHQPRKKNLKDIQTTETEPPPSPKPKDQVQAYDCSQMVEGDWGHWHNGTNCLYPLNITSKNDSADYLLLQEITAPQIILGRCQLRRTKVPLYCGYAHQPAILTTEIRVNQPTPLSARKCWQFQTTQKYVTKTMLSPNLYEKNVHQIKPNVTNQIDYDAFGRTYIKSEGEECWGWGWWSPTQKQNYDDVAEWRRDKIQFEQQPAYLDDEGRINLFQAPYKLPGHCKLHTGHCRTKLGTWVWSITTEWDKCRMMPIKWLQGMDLTIDYRSKSSSLFLVDTTEEYFWKKGTTFKCGREVVVTQKKDFYLQPRDLFPPFPEKGKEALRKQIQTMPPHNSTMSGQNLSDVQMLHELLKAACQEEVQQNNPLRKEIGNVYNHSTTMERILNLDNGTYFLQKGPLWKRVQCRTRLTRSRAPASCTRQLPVVPDVSQQSTFLATNVTSSSHLGIRNELPLYIEPYTYRLTNEPEYIDCTVMEKQSWKTTNQGSLSQDRNGHLRTFSPWPNPDQNTRKTEHPLLALWRSVEQWEHLPTDIQEKITHTWFTVPNVTITSLLSEDTPGAWWWAAYVLLGCGPVCLLLCVLICGRPERRIQGCRRHSPSTEPAAPATSMKTLQHQPPYIKVIVRRPDPLPECLSPSEGGGEPLATFLPHNSTNVETSASANTTQPNPNYDVPRLLQLHATASQASDSFDNASSTWASSN